MSLDENALKQFLDGTSTHDEQIEFLNRWNARSKNDIQTAQEVQLIGRQLQREIELATWFRGLSLCQVSFDPTEASAYSRGESNSLNIFLDQANKDPQLVHIERDDRGQEGIFSDGPTQVIAAFPKPTSIDPFVYVEGSKSVNEFRSVQIQKPIWSSHYRLSRMTAGARRPRSNVNPKPVLVLNARNDDDDEPAARFRASLHPNGRLEVEVAIRSRVHLNELPLIIEQTVISRKSRDPSPSQSMPLVVRRVAAADHDSCEFVRSFGADPNDCILVGSVCFEQAVGLDDNVALHVIVRSILPDDPGQWRSQSASEPVVWLALIDTRPQMPPDSIRRTDESEALELARFFHQHKFQLVVVARSQAKSIDFVEPEDIVQECFIAAVRRVEQWKAYTGSKLAWLLKLMTWTANEMRRRVRGRNGHKKRERPIADLFHFSKSAAHMIFRAKFDECQAFQFAEQSEFFEILLDAISELPEPQRICFQLRYFEELTISEIAQLLNAGESTVRSRLHRSKERLQAKLSGMLE